MIVRIAGRINVDGQWWDIETEHSVSDEFSPEGKVAHITAIIYGISKTGQIISRVGGEQPTAGAQNVTTRPPPVNGVQSPMFTWPIPHCGTHNEPLKLSKVQNDPAKTSFYCPKQMGAGYCRHRAKVDNSNGMPVFFEVK